MGRRKRVKISHLLAALSAWFAVAIVLTLVVPPPELGGAARFAIIVGPVAALTTLYAASRWFRASLSALPLRAFVALHLIRAPVGAWFLVLGGRGLLPPEFATQAGFGDILAGVGALAWLLVPNRGGRGSALALMVWSLFGIADFINVQRVVMELTELGRRAEFVAMRDPPLTLVPYFGVPLLWFGHVVVIARSASQLMHSPRNLRNEPPSRVSVRE
jgi:hypothetical protein